MPNSSSPPPGAASVEDMFSHLETMRLRRPGSDGDTLEIEGVGRGVEAETVSMTLLLECPPDTCEWTRTDLEPASSE